MMDFEPFTRFCLTFILLLSGKSYEFFLEIIFHLWLKVEIGKLPSWELSAQN